MDRIICDGPAIIGFGPDYVRRHSGRAENEGFLVCMLFARFRC